MFQVIIDGVWYPQAEFVETVVTELVPVLFPSYDIVEPDFQFLGGHQGRGLLASSLARPMPYFGQDRYPTIAEKDAALMWSITLNHPFNDGNKRASLTTAFVFIVNNGHLIAVDQDEAVEMCLRIAANTPGYTEAFVATWFRRHMFSLDHVSDESANEATLTQMNRDPSGQLWGNLKVEQQHAWLAFYRVVANL